MPSSRVLFILYHYPPSMGTAARRNHRISLAISGHTETADVFTASPTDKQVNRGIAVQHIDAIDYRMWLRHRTKDAALPETSKQNMFSQWMIRLINTFPFNIIAGEGGLVYFFNLRTKASKLVREKGITHIYSSFRPFTDHYAAYTLKRKYPHLVWIADFRDLIIDPHYQHIFFERWHHRFFKSIFSHANVLTTVSDGLAMQLSAYHPHVITLRNGVPDDMTHQSPTPCATFSIVYTGSMFLDKRNAEPLFIAIRDLIRDTKVEANDIRIIYAGKDSTYWQNLAVRYRFESLLDDRKIVSPNEARELQQQACINVLLTIASEDLQGVLTGKMIEYLEAGSPVLGIVVNQNDTELKSILVETQIGDSFPEDDLAGIKEFIWQEYQAWKSTGLNRKPVNQEMLKTKYSMKSTIKPLLPYL